MKKELQDKAWSVLPKEFKREIRKMVNDNGYAYEQKLMLRILFSDRNINSNTDEEDKSQFKPKFNLNDKVTLNDEDDIFIYTVIDILEPEEDEILYKLHCGAKEIIVNESQLLIRESKFKEGDEAFYICSPTIKHKCTITKVMQNKHNGKWEYDVMFEWGKPGKWIPESDLKSYTEPMEVKSEKEETTVIKHYFISYIATNNTGTLYSSCLFKTVNISLDGIASEIAKFNNYQKVSILSLKDLTEEEYKMLSK